MGELEEEGFDNYHRFSSLDVSPPPSTTATRTTSENSPRRGEGDGDVRMWEGGAAC